MAPKWNRRPCGCVKTSLPKAGKVLIHCSKHRGRPEKEGRLVCYFDDDRIVRVEA